MTVRPVAAAASLLPGTPLAAAGTPRIRCPRCETALRERVRDGVLVDTCPRCDGVWLDRGELERLLRRAAPGAARTGATVLPFRLDRYA